MIGERVRHARNYHGWSQAQLAKAVGVTQPAISQIEKGASAADETIAAIARETQFAPWFFTLGALPDLSIGSLKYRKPAGSNKTDDERVRAHVRQAIEVLNRHGQVAEPPPVRIKPLGANEEVDDDRIEKLADETREVLGVGPLDPIPNVMRAVERSGVAVIGSLNAIKKHDGASFWPDYPHGRPIICFTRGMSGDRERLTMTHEVGHLVLHTLRRVDQKRAEAEAFRFGAALLLPADAVDEAITLPVTLRSLATAKARYGMSIRVMVRRCLDLHVIDQDRRLSLEKQISSRGWRRNEPVEVPEESPQLVRQVVELSTGLHRPMALTAKLGLPPLAVRDLLG